MSNTTELREKGNAAFAAKRFHEALTLYEEAIVLDPHNVDLLNNAAAANQALNRYDEAISCAKRSINIRDNSKAHTRIGAALWSLNKLSEAIAEYEKASALAPGNDSIESSLRTLRRLLLQQYQQQFSGGFSTVVPPTGSTGRLGVLIDFAVASVSALTLLCLILAPTKANGAWVLLLILAMIQQGFIAYTCGLVKPSKAVLMKWGDHRCTLQLLLCFFAIFTGVGPLMMMVVMLGLFGVVNLSTKQNTLANAVPAFYRFCSPYLQKIVTQQSTIIMYAAALEAVMLFTIMFSGGAIFTLVYIQYVKNLYRIDSNTRLAFTGIRMNLSRLTRNPYVPTAVDAAFQKMCDTLFMLSERSI